MFHKFLDRILTSTSEVLRISNELPKCLNFHLNAAHMNQQTFQRQQTTIRKLFKAFATEIQNFGDRLKLTMPSFSAPTFSMRPSSSAVIPFPVS